MSIKWFNIINCLKGFPEAKQVPQYVKAVIVLIVMSYYQHSYVQVLINHSLDYLISFLSLLCIFYCCQIDFSSTFRPLCLSHKLDLLAMLSVNPLMLYRGSSSCFYPVIIYWYKAFHELSCSTLPQTSLRMCPVFLQWFDLRIACLHILSQGLCFSCLGSWDALCLPAFFPSFAFPNLQLWRLTRWLLFLPQAFP